jgi:hypothetical protein
MVQAAPAWFGERFKSHCLMAGVVGSNLARMTY